MDLPPPPLLLITGLMASGKSSVAQALAERLPKSVHLRGDLFRRLIVRGQAEMAFHLSPEAAQQLTLRYQIAAAAARLYLQAGFPVVYQDIILGPTLAEVAQYYQSFPLHIIVLCPSVNVIAAREAARSKSGYRSPAEIAAFDHVLRTQTPRLGLWLDTSSLTLPQTVDAILHRLPQSRIDFSQL